MRFTKYEKWGAYHWKQYADGGKYTRHVDRISKWVKEKSILDIGCGDGCITAKIGAFGIDAEESAIKLARQKGVEAELGDAYDLSKEGQFEAVTMFDVLEHFDHPALVLFEISRHTRTLYISTPPKRDDGQLTDKQFHVQEWSPQGLEEFMLSCGWKLIGMISVLPSEKVMYAKFQKI